MSAVGSLGSRAIETARHRTSVASRKLAPLEQRTGDAALSAFPRANACGRCDHLHNLVDILSHSLKFPAGQVQLSVGAGNLGVRSNRCYLLHVNVNRSSAGCGQLDPNQRAAGGRTAHWGSLYDGSPRLSLALGFVPGHRRDPTTGPRKPRVERRPDHNNHFEYDYLPKQMRRNRRLGCSEPS
jgi:hypothetical protein